jgi:hypothetical protein
MFDDPAAIATTAFAFRIGERIMLSLIVVLVALVVTLGFWRSIQKLDFSVGQGGVTGGGSVMLATPVLALLALIGFAWVSFSHPVSVSVPTDAGIVQAEASVATASQVAMSGSVPARPAPDFEFRQAEALRRVQSLNCVAQIAGDALSVRDADALAAAKLVLMQSVWSDEWGDFLVFEDWALGLAASAPTAAGKAAFEAVHPLC